MLVMAGKTKKGSGQQNIAAPQNTCQQQSTIFICFIIHNSKKKFDRLYFFPVIVNRDGKNKKRFLMGRGQDFSALLIELSENQLKPLLLFIRLEETLDFKQDDVCRGGFYQVEVSTCIKGKFSVVLA